MHHGCQCTMTMQAGQLGIHCPAGCRGHIGMNDCGLHNKTRSMRSCSTCGAAFLNHMLTFLGSLIPRGRAWGQSHSRTCSCRAAHCLLAPTTSVHYFCALLLCIASVHYFCALLLCNASVHCCLVMCASTHAQRKQDIPHASCCTRFIRLIPRGVH